MADRFPAVPAPVRSASVILVVACCLGIVLTGYAAWASLSVPAGVAPLTQVLTKDDRWVLRDTWVLQAGQPNPLVENLPGLMILGLGFLVLLPLAYYLRRGYRPARTVAYVFCAVLTGATAFAIITDEAFAGVDGQGNVIYNGLDQLSPAAHAAWNALFPPGYAGIHLFVLVALLACVFVACVLLDRPAANKFFVRRVSRRRVLRVRHPRLRPDGREQS